MERGPLGLVEPALLAQVLIFLDGERVVDEAHQIPRCHARGRAPAHDRRLRPQEPFVLLLAGQTSLDDGLQEPVHHALDQRITTVARLLPLSAEETRTYLETRLKAAGANRPVFEDGAMEVLYDATVGVPRRINTMATSALVVAAARNRRLVGAQDVKDAQIDRGRP